MQDYVLIEFVDNIYKYIDEQSNMWLIPTLDE